MKEKVTVVKAGGRVLDSETELQKLMQGVAAIPGKKILVHGGGIFITELCEKLGIETRMVDGRRITSQENMEVVLMACAGKLNKGLVAGLNKMGMQAVGLCGGDLNLIESVKRPVHPINFGMVGDVTKVNIKWLSFFMEQEVVPVISSISQSDQFELLNTNADTIAASVASALADKYDVTAYFYFDKPGVLRDANDDTSLISCLNVAEIEEMKAAKAIHAGMLPKLKNGLDCLRQGVSCVVLGDNLQERAGTELTLN